MKATTTRVTRTRADRLAVRRRTAYWIVLSYQDGLDVLAGVVPRTVRQQLLPLLKRARAESTDEYLARVAEATPRRRRKADA
jgi:hypothetical protein